MGKLLTYDSLVSKINDKIDLIRRYGKDVSKFEEKLNKIINGDIDYPPYLDESNSKSSNILTKEIKYEEKIKELNELMSELENYEKYIIVYFKNESLKNEIESVKPNKDLNDFVLQAKSILKSIEDIEYQDSEEELGFNNNIYKTIYGLIKLELIYKGESSLLDYIIKNDKGIEFINDLVREDLSKIDINNDENKDIKTKVLELSSLGMNYNFANSSLILMILLKTDSRVVDAIEFKINKLKEKEKEFEGEIKDISDNLKVNKSYKDMVVKKRKKARIRALIMAGNIILNCLTFKITNGIVKDSCTDTKYKTTREVYDTYTGEVRRSSDLEYKSKDNYVYIKDYSEVDKKGSRTLKTKTLDVDEDDIKEYGNIDLGNIGSQNTSNVNYSTIDQLTKDRYRIVEKVTYDKEEHTNFDKEKYEKIMKIIFYNCIGLSSIETLLLLRYLIIAISNDIKKRKVNKSMLYSNNRKSHFEHWIKNNKKELEELESIKDDAVNKTLDKERYLRKIHD